MELILKLTGEVLALVGESGSGKSVRPSQYFRCCQIMRMFLARLNFKATNYWALVIKNSKVFVVVKSVLFSGAYDILNPLHTIEKQLREAVELHSAAYFSNISEYIFELLTEFGIDSPRQRQALTPTNYQAVNVSV